MTIRALEASGIFEMLPKPTIAVMYQPYAEGWGAASQIYGTMRYPSDEPIALFRQLKFGTKYGQVDYLTPLHIDVANLDEYGVILAPFAVNIPANHMAKLTEYVKNGGVLFSDVGFGCIQAGKRVTDMTESAKKLFGIGKLQVSEAKPGRFVVTDDFSDILEDMELKESTAILTKLPLDIETTTAIAALSGPGKQGMFINKFCRGYAIFCSALAWNSVTVRDPLMRKIHNALFSRRAQIENIGKEDYCDSERA